MSVIKAPPATELQDTPILTEAEQRLLNAERYMREHGWCRGLRDDAGRVCLLGALAFGNGHRTVYTSGICRHTNPAYIALRKAIGPYPTVEWNDLVCKNEDEALAKLREAREILASGGTA